MFGKTTATSGWQLWVQEHLVIGNGSTFSPYYMGIFFILIVFFTYFYVSITFNPTEVADNMKKYGGFIPGIRPGGRPPGISSSCSAG